MPHINDDKSRNKRSSVQHRSWRDGFRRRRSSGVEQNFTSEDDQTPLSEPIPKMTEEELENQRRWQNSHEMQQGLQDMLPKDTTSTVEENTPLSLDQIREEESSQPQKSSPINNLIVNFYGSVQGMGRSALDEQLELELAKLGINGVSQQEQLKMMSKITRTGQHSSALASNLDKTDAVAKGVASGIGSVASGLVTLKSGVYTIKQIYDAYKDATSGAGNTTEDKLIASLRIVKELIATAHGAISLLKSVLDLFQQASGALGSAIPGLGIALNAVSIAIDVYKLMKAKTNEAFIKKQLKKNRWESILGYRKNKKGKRKKAKGKDKRNTQSQYIAIYEEEFARMTNEREALMLERAACENDPDRQDELAEIDAKIRSKDEMLALTNRELSSLKDNQALTNLQQINQDRVHDAGFDIGLQFTSLLGNVFALVPEPGVQAAGIALRAAAAGAYVFKKIGGFTVQKMRNYADRNPESSLNGIVDSSRSEQKELVRQKESVRYIFHQIDESDLSNKESVRYLNNHIQATGAEPRRVAMQYNSKGLHGAAKTLIQAQGN